VNQKRLRNTSLIDTIYLSKTLNGVGLIKKILDLIDSKTNATKNPRKLALTPSAL